MFRRIALVTACTAASLVGVAAYTFAEDPKVPTTPQMPDMAAMEKAWKDAMTPGEEHKKMAETAGDWTCVVEDFSSGQPMKSEGSAKFSMILGGRFLQQEFHGAMGGEKFEGMGITGFDNSTQMFQEVWIDSMGTAVYFAKGKRLDANSTETKGKMSMPGAGEIDTRSVAKHKDKDHMTFEMYGIGPGGQEMLFVRIEYTRKM